jgi:triphosphatase
MSEQELKLHVPRASRRGVEREVRAKDATTVRLHAMYFDTPERELAKARIALRLRKEGREWIQTLKMPGANAITRIEINHPRPGPILDLSLYAGTEVEAPLSAIRGELGLRYETDVQRILRKVRSRAGTVEIAYDIGILRAASLELPISEVEFELMSGRPAAIFAVGRAWQQRHGLLLDARSKSERGDALANTAYALSRIDPESEHAGTQRAGLIARFWAPRDARGITLHKEMNASEALSAITEECLDHIVRNAAVLSEVDTNGVYQAGGPEHVHQLRVAMRRLRSAWRLFDGIATLPPEPLQEDIRVHFEAFGSNRDDDVFFGTVGPALIAAGMPACEIPVGEHDDNSHDCAVSKPFQAWLLALLEWNVLPQPLPVETVSATSLPVAGEEGVTSLHSGAAANEGATTGASDGEVHVADPTLHLDPSMHSPPIAPTIIPLHHVPAPTGLRGKLVRRLRRLHKRVVSEGLTYAELEVEAKHQLRKRAKRLRYGLNFVESLLAGTHLRAYRKQLAAVQDILGEFNDLAVAQTRYAALVDRQPQAWYALGWITARQHELVGRAEVAFEALSHAPPFWK